MRLSDSRPLSSDCWTHRAPHRTYPALRALRPRSPWLAPLRSRDIWVYHDTDVKEHYRLITVEKDLQKIDR